VKQTLFQGTQWQIVVNNGTARTLTFDTDGQLYVPSNLSIANAEGFKGSISSSALTADRAFTLPNRAGSIALEDSTSLNAMLPNQAGHVNNYLQTDGAGVLSWTSSIAAAITSLNGNTTSSQTLTYSQSGTAPTWSTPTGSTVQLAIPLASTASVTAGLLSNADYAKIGFKDGINTWSAAQTFTNAPTITNVSTSSNAVATVGQVNAASAGISIRKPIAVIDIASGTKPTINPVIDGYTLQLNDRVLFTNLGAGNNQIYKATGSLGSVVWTLETDGQNGDGTPDKGDIVFIDSGNHAYQQWAYEGTGWVRYNSAVDQTFSTGLINTSGTITVDWAASGTTSSTQSVRADDSRLSDARTPTSHSLTSHSSVNSAGQILLGTGPNAYSWQSVTGDITLSGGGVVVVTNLPSGVTAAGSILFTAIVAPGNPAAGKALVYVDSTSKNFAVKNDAGVINHGVQTKTATANQFLTAISDAGVVSSAQPAFTDISGTATTAQIPLLDFSKISSGIVPATQGGTGLNVAAFWQAPLAAKVLVRAASTTNQAITGTYTLDGVALAANDRVLLTGQTTPSQNGLWLAQAGAWTRPLDYQAANTAQAFYGMTVTVSSGTANAGSTWYISTTAAITIDTTSVTFTQLATGVGSGDVVGVLPVANGGTGVATLASNGILYGNGTGNVQVTAAGTADQILRIPGAGGAPSFGSIDLSKSAAVGTSILPVANGGVGVSLTATGGASMVLKQTSVGGNITVAQLAFTDISGTLAISAGGTGLSNTAAQNAFFVGPVSGGAGAPTWRAMAAADLVNHQLDDNTKHFITGKTAGQVLIALTATTYGFRTVGGDITIDGSAVASVAQIGGVAINDLGLSTTTATLLQNKTTGTWPVTGLTFAPATYRSVVVEYQLSRGAGNYATGQLILLYDGTYGRLTQVEHDAVGSTGVTFTADPTASTMAINYLTTAAPATNVTMYYRIKTFLV
jgi:hypothetical protein